MPGPESSASYASQNAENVESESSVLSRLDRVLAALREREAYSKESAPVNPQDPNRLTQADFIELKPEELAFMRRFFNFRSEISAGLAPDYIFVPTASPLIDRDRFHDRVDGGVNLGTKYPEARVIFAGKMPAPERRTGQEEEIGSEASLMAEEAEQKGLSAEQIIMEEESGHAKESIEFFLRDHHDEIMKSEEPIRVIIATSQTMIQRCRYCVNYFLRTQFPELAGKVEFYYEPAGNDLDAPNDRVKYYDDEGNVTEEGGYFAAYEARRLLEYRKKGWL